MVEEIEMEVPGKVQNTAPVAPPVEKKPVEVRPSPLIDHSRIPYPARAKQQKYTREYGHIHDMFRKLKINLPFIETLQHMPKYAKFLKDLLKRKDRLGEVSSIPLMGGCSAVVLNRVPEKLSDPGVFKIPGLFGSDAMSHALADLGASINLMPYSLYEKLELGELTPTRMSLSLADHSVKYPRGIDSCFNYICGADLVGSNGLKYCDDLGEDESCENDSFCDELDKISGLPEMIEVNEISCESEAGSMEKPTPLEMKVLPSHLEYAYLDEGSNLPVIVSSKLTEEQKTKLIDVLKLHKGAIARRLSNIQGINPAYCTHRILMEDEYKLVVQPQRRLNPNMQELVKKKALKLMDFGMIYPISNSPWVSLTQVVPKKGGMTVVMNEKNELIPSRTVTALRFLFQKKDTKPRLIWWILLLSEFDIEIKDKKGAENVAADHLSRLKDPRKEELREEEIGDTFPHESIDFVAAEKQGLTGGYHGAHATAQKVFDSGFYWPTVVKDAEEFVKLCDVCQRTGNISSKNEMSQNPIQILEIFGVWAIDFIGPFSMSNGNKYILMVIDYVSKWVESQTLATNDAQVVVRFIKKLFTHFGTPRAIISDRGTHFCNSIMEKALARYGVTHRTSTAYHPQTNGQVKNANRGVKRILEKTVGASRKDWSEKLDDAL
ncbi:uncharacterized protein LOC143604825 [Bidens hawaiensis]|uniref:uncharacterized protein LOC143604825 n=1 Tax=Bidens hawaiensis TaxID=980011 RepID=UPI00404B6C63